MSEEIQPPCPLCGKPGLRSATRNRPFCANDRCSMNGMTFSDEEWDGLYQAMQLKRAVQKLEEQSDGMNFNRYQDRWMARTYTLATYQDTLPVGDFDSLAAALIALAGENRE